VLTNAVIVKRLRSWSAALSEAGDFNVRSSAAQRWSRLPATQAGRSTLEASEIFLWRRHASASIDVARQMPDSPGGRTFVNGE
jgi:hypothetical protein